MKKMWKRGLCFGLTALLLLSLTGCSLQSCGGGGNSQLAELKDPNAAKEAVYDEVGFYKPKEDYNGQILSYNGEVYLAGIEWVDTSSGGGEMIPEESVDAFAESQTEEPSAEEGITDEEAETVTTEGNEADAETEDTTTEADTVDEETEDTVTEDNAEEVTEDDLSAVNFVEDYEYHFVCKIHFEKLTFDDSTSDSVIIDMPQDEYVGIMLMNPTDGNLIVISDYSSEEMISGEYVYKSVLCWNEYDQNGNLLFRQELDLQQNPDEYMSVSGITIDSSGNIVVASGHKILIFDDNFNVLSKINFSETQWVESIFTNYEGATYAFVWDENGEGRGSYLPIDVAAGTSGSPMSTPQDFWGRVYPGPGHDMYYMTDKGFMAYDFDTQQEVCIMNYIDSDLDYQYINGCYPVDETHIIVSSYDAEYYTAEYTLMEKVPPEEVVDKTIITLGMVYMDYQINSKVIAFNKESDEYRIRVIDYSQYNSDENWEAGMQQLSNDIITSNAPDIIVMETTMPIQSFMEKGVLMNLNDLIEADPDISKENFAPNVLAMGSKGDNTYILSANYMINTMVMKESFLNGKENITLQELMQLEKQLGITALTDMTREDVLRSVMDMIYAEFLDRETGKCNFNSQAFYDLLEYIKQYPAEIDWDSLYNDDTYWATQETLYREDHAILQYVNIGDFQNVGCVEQGTFGEKIAFTGFPVSGVMTGSVIPYTQLAISSDCENPEAAWEFMRQFYTYEAQSEAPWGIPTDMRVMDEMLQRAQERPYWIDENGEKVEFDNTYWIGDQEIIIEPLTAERAAEVKEYVLSVDKMYFYDHSIIDIIVEEAEPFFAGQKTAQQAADIIQSRVQIYVNENQ